MLLSFTRLRDDRGPTIRAAWSRRQQQRQKQQSNDIDTTAITVVLCTAATPAIAAAAGERCCGLVRNAPMLTLLSCTST